MEQRNTWLALTAMGLAMLVIGLDVTVFNVALPVIAADLDASTSQLQWIVNAYVLAMAGAILPAGIIADRVGRRATLLVGLALFLVSSICAALTDSIGLLIVMRAAMGIGAAIITPIVMALIPIMFDDEERPRAVGALTAATSIGLPLGPIVGGYLLDRFAWSSIFWINVPVAVIALGATFVLIGESRDPSARRLDIPGAISVVLGIVALVYGLVEAPEAGWLSGETLGWVGAGVGLLAGFVAWQMRTRQPLVDLSLFRDARFSGGMVSMVMVMFVMYGLLFTLPLYLQGVRGEDALGTGLWLTPMMAGILVAALSSKPLLGWIGARIGIVVGLIISTGALVALARVEVDTSMRLFGVALAVFGLGLGVAMTSAMDAVLGSLPRDRAGSGSGVVNALRQVSGALGVAILGSVLSSLYRRSLDDANLATLPPEAASAVRESIIAANAVAGALGSDGEALRRMAGAGYTDAMAGVLWISAIAAVVAAIVSAVVVPGRRTTVAELGAATRTPVAGTYE